MGYWSLTRREFLGLTVAALAELAVKGCVPLELGKDSFAVENNYLSLGPEQTVDLARQGIENYPDTRMPFITLESGVKRYFVSANQRSYAVDCSNPLDFPGKKFVEVFGPNREVPHRNGYATVNSVLNLDAKNPDHLTGIAHYERHKETATGLDWRDYTGSIGMVESFDSGLSWEDKGVILSSKNAIEPGNGRVSGVGQPCAIARQVEGQNYVYIYYLNSNTFNICLSRAPIVSGNIGRFEHWTKYNRFEQGEQINPETSKVIIPAPDTIKSKDKHTALPSITVHGDELWMIYETNESFKVCRSKNGIDWSNHETAFAFPSELYPPIPGQEWYSNPTLLSASESNDQSIGKEGYLIYSKGIRYQKPHFMGIRKFTVK